MSSSDLLLYVITLIIFCFLKQKFEFAREITESDNGFFLILKNLLLFIGIYLMAWSIANWCFYVNLFFLMNKPFNYDFFTSFHYAINMTNEYSSAGFYMEWFLKRITKNIQIDLFDEFIHDFRKMLDDIGEISDDKSELTYLKDLLQFFY